MTPAPPEVAAPKLRPSVRVAPHRDGRVAVFDARRLSPSVLFLDPSWRPVLDAIDGRHSAAELAALTAGRHDADTIGHLLRALDESYLLAGATFEDYRRGPTRLPACAGSYPAGAGELAAEVRSLLATAPPGAPAPGRLCAALAPHMDYGRGGATYGAAFAPLVAQTDARLFLVLATSHYSHSRVTLTAKDYATPLGAVETDQAFVKCVSQHYGPDCLTDLDAHLPEHSIELEVPFLQVGLGSETRPVRLVPVLIGSMRGNIDSGLPPWEDAGWLKLVKALRRAVAEAGEPVCVLVSGDLAHVGPKFGDPRPVGDAQLESGRAADAELLARLEAADAAGYYSAVAAEGDARRICGLAPTWVGLEVARPRVGVAGGYQQYKHPRGEESVSFAAAHFYE